MDNQENDEKTVLFYKGFLAGIMHTMISLGINKVSIPNIPAWKIATHNIDTDESGMTNIEITNVVYKEKA